MIIIQIFLFISLITTQAFAGVVLTGSEPFLAITGDSIAAGHNTTTPYYPPMYEGGTGTITSEISHQMSAMLKNQAITFSGYTNHAKGSQTFAWVASTGGISAITTGAKAILIHCGVNDVALGRSWSEILANLNTIKALLGSGQHLFIDEILPWTAGNDTQAATVRTFNANLAAWCLENDATLIRCHDAMGQIRSSTGQIDNLATAYNQDGVHLTQAGVDAMAQIWADALTVYYRSGEPVALEIPLIVEEALPLNVSGLNRTNELVSGGIPLPIDSGISSVSQLGLSGPSSGQFRALGRWPNGNIKWVLLDFPLSVSADAEVTTVTLVNGTGNFGGGNLAVDNGSTINVNTGAATFSIKKANFNVFDSVVIGGTSLISSGNTGSVHIVGGDSTDYYSRNDDLSTAIIEENGPVKTVIKATGACKSASGVRLIDYTVRMTFFKNSPQVKSSVIIRNASRTNAKKGIQFKSIEVITPLATELNVNTAVFGRVNNGVESEVTTSVGAADTAWLMQGYIDTPSDYNQSNIVDRNGGADAGNPYGLWVAPLPTRFESYYGHNRYDPAYWGVQIDNNGPTAQAFGNYLDNSNSVGSLLNSSGQGVTLGYRKLSDYWPGGFEVNGNGNASIELYSKRNDGSLMTGTSRLEPFYLGFSQHDRRDVMWDFHTSGADRQKTKYALEYPLTVRAALQHYNDANVFFGSKIASVAEEQAFWAAECKTVYPATVGPPSSVNVAAYAYRGWFWGADGGPGMQQNYTGAYLTKWLKTGHGGYYLRGKNRTILDISSSIDRRDDFTVDDTVSIDTSGVPYYLGKITTGTADGEHRMLYTIPLYYYITGDEEAKDAFLTFGDTMRKTTSYPLDTPYGGRAAGNTLRNAVSSYEFGCETGNCNNAIKTAVDTEISRKIDTIQDPQHRVGAAYYGRDLDRGYMYNENDYPTTYTHSMYGNTVLMDGMWQARRVMLSGWWGTGYSRMDEYDDLMYGFAKFHVKEFYRGPASTVTTLIPTQADSTWGIYAGNPFNATHGQLLNYKFHETTLPTDFNNQTGFTSYPTQRAAMLTYQQEPLSKYLDLGYSNVWQSSNFYGGDAMRLPNEFQDQTAVYYYSRESEIPTWQPLTINTVDNGNGSYTLSWTVPTGVKRYQIKHAIEPIVEWLEFNHDTRTFGYDPAVYTPFFAATNITNPEPATEGTTQSITLTGLPTNSYFSAKWYNGDDYESVPSSSLCYPDADSDTYGDSSSQGTQRESCLTGEVTNHGDCNDANAAIHPGATEVCGNLVDEDCSGSANACPGSNFHGAAFGGNGRMEMGGAGRMVMGQ